MYFQHSSEIWDTFPELVPGALTATGISAAGAVDDPVARFSAIAKTRLEACPESELPEIQAWRRAFTRMGLKPTQYRCASESLLRRFRKEGSLPRIHPLIDLCNAISLAFAVPVAVFDVSAVTGFVEVRRASGSEAYETFSGEIEHPDPGEVIFADEAGRAHARRWVNRQSGASAVRETMASVLIVSEGLHDSAEADVGALMSALSAELDAAWSSATRPVILSRAAPRLDF